MPVNTTGAASRSVLNIVIVGHVDHGKSTLVGRLLYDTDSLPAGKYEELVEVSRRRGMPVEFSFVLDAFQAERDQAVTIDTTQIRFHTARRDYVVIDAPGHREFLQNMISGASSADAAILVVDAIEGLKAQTRQHAYLLQMLDVRQIVVVVNKMDLAGHDQARFDTVAGDVTAYLGRLGLKVNHIIPVCAREGDNMARRSGHMRWYAGPTMVDALDEFRASAPAADLPLRLPIQDVYKFDARRILAGRIETGALHVGDRLLFSPSNKEAVVQSIEAWNQEPLPMAARAGQSVGITLDTQLFIERGEIATTPATPPILTNVFRATIFWLGRKPLEEGARYHVKLGTGLAHVSVQSVEHVIDTDTLERKDTRTVQRNEMARVVLRTRELIALDEHKTLPRTGRVVLIDGVDTVGGGLVSMEGYPDQRRGMTVRSTNLHMVAHRVRAEERALRNGHKGGVLWFTGLSGAGKSTLAMALEQHLFDKGRQVYVLDGDNVRHRLNADLGFSPDDRAENIRRVGQVAALFADAGYICITAFISPYRDDRENARHAHPDGFHEIYVHADVATCEKRDPKGLYAKARAGEIKEFTGVSAPYEPPESPELVVDTETRTPEECLEQLAAYVEAYLKPDGA